MSRTVKFAITSDLHGMLPYYEYRKAVEKCDALLVCGDIFGYRRSPDLDWFGELNSKGIEVIVVPGNHDLSLFNWYLQLHPEDRNPEYCGVGGTMELGERLEGSMSGRLPNCHAMCLIDGAFDFMGVKIYGTPWTPTFFDWAFMGDSDLLKRKFSAIPDGVDILISHGPPKYKEYKFDCPLVNATRKRHCGSPELAEAILEKKPKYCFFGHIHTGVHRMVNIGETKCANVSIVDEDYRCVFPPRILEMSVDK